MANRYWVGGTAAWDAIAGTKWALTSGGAGGQAIPTSADDVFFSAASTGTCTISGGNTGAKSINCTGFTATLAGSAAITVAGSVTFVAGMTLTYTGTLTLSATGTLTGGGKTLGPVTVSGSGITVTLGDAVILGAARTFTLTQGTLDLGGFTLSTGAFASSNTNTRSIAFGSTNIALTDNNIIAITISMGTATGFTFTGTGGFTRNNIANTTFVFGNTAGGTVSNAPNVSVTAGASNVLFNAGSYFKNVNFTGSTSTVTQGTYNACGNLTLASGGTYTALNPTFLATGTFTSVGKTIGSPTINGTGITVTLGDALTLATNGIFNLTQGTLNLNGFTASLGQFNSSNSNTRSITFGSANIALTSTIAGSNAITMDTATNFTWTGTGGFTRNTGTGAYNQIAFGSTAGGTVSNAPNLSLTGGTSFVGVTSGSYLKNLICTGYSGTLSAATGGATSINICGNLTLSSGGTYTDVTAVFLATGTLTNVSKTLAALTVNGSGITVTLADAGNNATTTLTNGTLNLAGFTLTATTTATTAAGTKNLTFNGGTLACSAASTTAWNNANPTGFTTTAGTGTGIISMTAATAKTFVGGGSTYNCTLNQGGAGTLTITGANTFNNITNTNATASQITFPASTTTTVNNFTLSGTSGNLVSIRSSTPATQFTLSDASGVVSVSYLDIQDSNATGGAIWQSYTTNGNVNSGNNTGWIFTLNSGNAFLLFF